jgi:hypothetical protein
MEEDKVQIEFDKSKLAHDFGKMIVGVSAAFLAKFAAEHAFEAIVNRRQTPTATTEQ